MPCLHSGSDMRNRKANEANLVSRLLTLSSLCVSPSPSSLRLCYLQFAAFTVGSPPLVQRPRFPARRRRRRRCRGGRSLPPARRDRPPSSGGKDAFHQDHRLVPQARVTRPTPARRNRTWRNAGVLPSPGHFWTVSKHIRNGRDYGTRGGISSRLYFVLCLPFTYLEKNVAWSSG